LSFQNKPATQGLTTLGGFFFAFFLYKQVVLSIY